MAETPTRPPNDRQNWRRLVGRAHPDAGGDHELFIWAAATRDAVCGGEVSPPPTNPKDPDPEPDRVPYEAAFEVASSFDALTDRATMMAFDGNLHPSYARVLKLLEDCYDSTDPTLFRQQHQGATYKQLAAIAYKANMTKDERVGWYRVAEEIPLAQRHAGHILGRMNKQP